MTPMLIHPNGWIVEWQVLPIPVGWICIQPDPRIGIPLKNIERPIVKIEISIGEKITL